MINVMMVTIMAMVMMILLLHQLPSRGAVSNPQPQNIRHRQIVTACP
jgi:hypothetical protein